MRVRVGDVHLFFDVDGAKLRPEGPRMREVPTILMLHGGPGFDHSVFKPDLSGLVDIAQIVYLDHRGNGRSDRSGPENLNLERWGDDVRAFCELLEIERPIVLGESFGGMVAMAYASRHPDHPGKLILARTAAQRFFDNPSQSVMAEYIQKCLPLYTRRQRSPEWMARSVQNLELTLFFFQGEIRTFNLLPQLARIRCPTLITVGDMDPITPMQNSEDLAAALPANLVRLELFKNAGHAVQRDDPEKFDRVVREFIAS